MVKKRHFLLVCSCQKGVAIAHVTRGGSKKVEKVPRGAVFGLFPKGAPPFRIFFGAN